MHHELLAMERQAMQERINDLEAMLKAMESDFATCAKTSISPCFFCDNDDNCIGTPETCKFKWIRHN